MLTIHFTSRTDLVVHVCDTLDLHDQQTAVADAISAHRSLFWRFEDITEDELDALSRAVWADVTDGAAWPW